MFIRASHTSQTVNNILADLYMLKKPDGIQLKKKNTTRPFEETTTIEFLSKKTMRVFLYLGHTRKKDQITLLLDVYLITIFWI